MIKATLNGMSEDQKKREFIMGDNICPGCGQRSCGGECGPSMDRRPPMTDAELR